MMNPLGYMQAMYMLLIQSIGSKFPQSRGVITSRLMLFAIVGIIIVGAIIVIVLVTVPGVTTRSTYP